MDLNKLRNLIDDKDDLEIHSFVDHSKASERYVEVSFKHKRKVFWKGFVPYYYRRTGLFLENEIDILEYLRKIKHFFEPRNRRKWIIREVRSWENQFSSKLVTKPFFLSMSSLEWTSEFPINNNPQRRIQDIKELGYTIATRRIGSQTERILLPLPREIESGYEVIPTKLRSKILEVLKHLNSYEHSSSNRIGLLPDHKFPANLSFLLIPLIIE